MGRLGWENEEGGRGTYGASARGRAPGPEADGSEEVYARAVAAAEEEDEEEGYDEDEEDDNTGPEPPVSSSDMWSSQPRGSGRDRRGAAVADGGGTHILPVSSPHQSSFLSTAAPPNVLGPTGGAGALTGAAAASGPTSFEGMRKLAASAPGLLRGGASSSAPGGPLRNQPVTFKSKIKSSGYGAVAPRKPAWAKKSAAAAAAGGAAAGSASGAAVHPVLASHLYPASSSSAPDATLPLELDDSVLVTAGSARSGSAGRMLTSAGAGASSGSSSSLASTAPCPPRSASAIPCGSVSVVRFSDDGYAVAVGGHDGSLFTLGMGCVADRRAGWGAGGGSDDWAAAPAAGADEGDSVAGGLAAYRGRLRVRAAGAATRHILAAPAGSSSSSSSSSSTGAPPRLLCASWSHCAYAGLSTRLHQADPTATGKGPQQAALSEAAKSRLVLACGEDRSANVWAGASGRAEPILTLRAEEGSGAGAGAGAGTASRGGGGGLLSSTPATASPAITSGCFYYLDKFILLAAGPSILAHTWCLDGDGGGADGGQGGAEEDIVRLRRKAGLGGRQPARARLAASWKATEGGSTVVQLAAHNSFRSPLVFAACSDRSVRVFDCGAPGGQPSEVLRVPDAHSRAIHTLALPTASDFADPDAVPSSSLRCFLTASTDTVGGLTSGAGGGLVRLWDLRTHKCAVQLAGGHVNRVHACGAAISPDVTYVAVGSEDRSAVIYDLRKGGGVGGGGGGVVAKLKGATDTVTSVAWHPLTPSLVTGSLDGGVRFYGMAGRA
jgi:WD40 repeat protein